MKKLIAVLLIFLVALTGCTTSNPANEQGNLEEPVVKEAEQGPKVGQTASVHKGRYTGGSDIPVGSYLLTRSSSESGIVWLAAPDDNLEEHYPSLIYEYVGINDDASFFISLQEGGILDIPFDCELTVVDYSGLGKGGSVPAYMGSYTGGVDMPAGQYVLEYDESHTGSGIIWLSEPDDDLLNEYPDKIYEYVSSKDPGKWFISLEEGAKLYLPFVCKSITRVSPITDITNATEIYAGLYVVGIDIAPGKYNITCTTNSYNSGIVWASLPDDDLDNEYPSVLYEYISYNSEESFYVGLEEGARLYLPCDATIESAGVVFN